MQQTGEKGTMSQQPKKICVIIGTRPEAIKLAPVVRELRKNRKRWQVQVVATAQHRQMLDQILSLFDIQPDHDLNIMRHGQNLFDVTRRALMGLGEVLESTLPDFVIVQGDTTSTFAGALAAFYLQIQVGHVEAGLRTGRIYSPFPEEANRCLTSRLTTLHFAPTLSAYKNLSNEGVDDSKVLVTGNTVIDALMTVASKETGLRALPSSIKLDDTKKLLLVTAHRRESFGEPIRRAFGALAQIANDYPDCCIVYPVHPNPNVKEAAEELLGRFDNVHLISPLDYQPFVHLMKCAHLIVTDSGGVQEEAPSLGVPVLVMREETERPEAVEAGTVKLVGTDPELINTEARRLLDDASYHESMANAVNPYGDGLASQRIEARMAHHFFGAPLPKAFSVRQK